jgi:hypothetical protein
MIEFRLTHDGTHWIAENETLSARGTTLEQLDRQIAATLRKYGTFERNTQHRVRMSFDNSTIPEWIRQYAGHYFNREVMISL